jgi:hypothetical protein
VIHGVSAQVDGVARNTRAGGRTEPVANADFDYI